jgi:hypothetical protein
VAIDQVSPRAKWLLLALKAAGDSGLTPVQLQKALFVFGKRSSPGAGGWYNFRPYDYGPFDVAVYNDAEHLSGLGYVHIESPLGSPRTFHLTGAGAHIAASFEDGLPVPARTYLSQVVGWCKRLSFSSLVRAIYEAYPEMRVNSVFKDS